MGTLFLTLAILLFSLYLGFRMLINSSKKEAGSLISKVGGIILISLTGALFLTVTVLGIVQLSKVPKHKKEIQRPEMMKMMMKHGPPGERFDNPLFKDKQGSGPNDFFKEKLENPEFRDKLKERLDEMDKNFEEKESELKEKESSIE